METPMSARSPHEVAVKALEDLEARLDKRDHSTRLWTEEGEVPRLSVANRHAQLGEDIFVDGQSYLWPWGQPIAAIGNPQAAATKVSHVLCARPDPSHV
jgi:hypothetical protein